MAVFKYLARQHEFYVSNVGNIVGNDVIGANWIPISGLNSWTWTTDTNDADTSDFDNAGWGSSLPVSHTATLTLEGFRLIDSATGARDSGQEECEVATSLLGTGAFRFLRVAARDSLDTMDIGHIIVQASLKPSGDLGGGVDDVVPWGIEAAVQGKPIGSGCYDMF